MQFRMRVSSQQHETKLLPREGYIRLLSLLSLAAEFVLLITEALGSLCGIDFAGQAVLRYLFDLPNLRLSKY
jgi:hypothetical protein